MPQPSIADVQTPDQFATSLPEQTKRAFREHQVYWRSVAEGDQDLCGKREACCEPWRAVSACRGARRGGGDRPEPREQASATPKAASGPESTLRARHAHGEP